MDTLTHGFVPYAVYTLLRMPRTHRIAVAFGAMAPDLDALWAWASHTHEYAYPLVHRGFSHTFWGAPLIAVGLLFVLARNPWTKRWQRSENVWFTRSTALHTAIGAWTHLLLDGVTITGVPLLWPFYDARFTADWFFFGVPFLLPVSLFAWIQLWRRKATDRTVAVSLVVLLVLLAIAGGVRAYSYPRDLVGDEDVTPGPLEWQWYVARRTEEGVRVYSTGFGGAPVNEVVFPESNLTAADAAIRACQERPGYVPWNWYLWGLAVINATKREDGGWSIVFQDSGNLYAERFPQLRWRNPTRDQADLGEGARCEVDPGGEAVFKRGRGWVGS